MINKNEHKKYHFLYKTTNLLNNKYYYGMHSCNKLNDNYLGSGKVLRHAIRKYGKENFKREILEFFDNREDLVNAEILLINESIVKDENSYNLKPGGSGGLGGMVTVKDNNNNCFNVYKDDPRYLSGELKSVATNRVIVKDNIGNLYSVYKDDPRYLSGELKSVRVGHIVVKDNDNNNFIVEKNDPRYLSGELKSVFINRVTVKDINGNFYSVEKDDPRYLSDELVFFHKGNKHTDETKLKIGKKNSISQKGEKNSQFGTCWITNGFENKKIKKEELTNYIDLGWKKGRMIN